MVHGRLCTQHHPPEVARLTALARSKKRREQHRTSVVADAPGPTRAEIIVPIESIDAAGVRDLEPFRQWFVRGGYRSEPLRRARSSASLVLDGFSFVLYLDGADRQFDITGTHDGERFVDAARCGHLDVYLTTGVDVRRATPEVFDEAARNGRLVGASVAAFVVDMVDAPFD